MGTTCLFDIIMSNIKFNLFLFSKVCDASLRFIAKAKDFGSTSSVITAKIISTYICVVSMLNKMFRDIIFYKHQNAVNTHILKEKTITFWPYTPKYNQNQFISWLVKYKMSRISLQLKGFFSYIVHLEIDTRHA